jgi:hypothetical protein
VWEGDSIGFWDEDRLVIHTSQMRAGQYQRIQPHYSDQIETVETWRKTDDDTLVAEIWCYDPPGAARAVVFPAGVQEAEQRRRLCGSGTGASTRIRTTRSS